MSTPTQQHVYILANPPTAEIQSDTFKYETRDLPEVGDGQLLVQIESLSNDPAQRTWMQKDADPERHYAPPIQKGDIVRASGIAKVLKSRSEQWKEGSRVWGYFGWYDYAVVPEAAIRGNAIDLPNMPNASLSVLGMSSVTAHQGIFDILDVKPEHVVLISGAAGAVGNMAVQLAKKVVGAKKVIGIAGGKAKCDWVKSLGADECVDYKDANFAENLKAAVGKDYIDRVFENVGGEVFNTVLPLMARYSKAAICGWISAYNGGSMDFSNAFHIISLRVDIQGFLVVDYLKEWPTAVKQLAEWIKDGKLKVTESEDVRKSDVKGIPEVWSNLFTGGNRGKLITSLQ